MQAAGTLLAMAVFFMSSKTLTQSNCRNKESFDLSGKLMDLNVYAGAALMFRFIELPDKLKGFSSQQLLWDWACICTKADLLARCFRSGLL